MSNTPAEECTPDRELLAADLVAAATASTSMFLNPTDTCLLPDRSGARFVWPRWGLLAHLRPTGRRHWSIALWVVPAVGSDFDLTRLALTVAEAGAPHATADVDIPAEAFDGPVGPGDVHYAFLRERLYEMQLQVQLRPLIDRVPGLLVLDAGGAMPFQAHGTWHGYPFYFRYRSGHASLDISDDLDTVFTTPFWSASCRYGDEHDGSLNMDEFTDLFIQLGAQLARAPFAYHFPDRDQASDATLGGALVWAHSLAEACRSLRTEVDDPDRFVPVPSNRDTRSFPPADPVFVVLPEETPAPAPTGMSS